MHKAADAIPSSLYPKIKSVVMFGDPNLRLGRLGDKFPGELRGRVLQNCAVGDPVSGDLFLWMYGDAVCVCMRYEANVRIDV